LLDSISYRFNKSISEIVLFLNPERKDIVFDKNKARDEYYNLLDKDYNATNSKAKGKNNLKSKALGLLMRKKEKQKTNVEVKDDLEKKGRFFFFISDKVTALLEAKTSEFVRKKLDTYNKLRRKLKL
jgi:hypothetical protein